MKDGEFLLKLGEQIKKLRQREKLSHSELALRADLEKSTVIRIEKGRMNPSAIILIKICKGLEVPIQHLFKFLPFEYFKQSES